jgi:hypothetical protein
MEQAIAFIAALGAVFEAVFAGILLLFIRRQNRIIEAQKGIMTEQKDVSKRQVELSQKIDESTKFAAMLQEYATLSTERQQFMGTLASLYKDIRSKNALKIAPQPDSFRNLLYETRPPEPVPLDQEDLQRYIEKHQAEWEELLIWEFLNLIWRDSVLGGTKLREAHSNLIRFWSKWCMLIDISKFLHYLEPEFGEPIMLVWVELANIKGIPVSTWPERLRQLFKLANIYCAWLQETSSTYRAIHSSGEINDRANLRLRVKLLYNLRSQRIMTQIGPARTPTRLAKSCV